MKSDFFAGLGLGLILLPLYAFLKELGALGNYMIIVFVFLGIILLIRGYAAQKK